MIRMLIKFALVGLTGVGVNMAVYIGLNTLNVNYLLAAIGSFWAAVTNNFVGNLLWTFKGRAKDKRVGKKYLLFVTISAVNLGVNLWVLQFLAETMKVEKTLAQFAAIGTVSGLNFILHYLITFGEQRNKNREEALISL
mgnify:CR=1 FL=1